MCRTANGWDINGMGQRKDGRGNICPVTIILPTLAMIAKNQSNNLLAYKMLEDDNETKLIEIERRFMKLLDTKIHEAKDMLIERFEYICSQSPACDAPSADNLGVLFQQHQRLIVCW